MSDQKFNRGFRERIDQEYPELVSVYEEVDKSGRSERYCAERNPTPIGNGREVVYVCKYDKNVLSRALLCLSLFCLIF
jgi:hypothetical protein